MKKLLIVEDNPDVSTMLQNVLKPEGYEIFVAADGWQGLELFQQIKPQVLLLDLGLPSLSGLEVLRAITPKHHRTFSVIVLTAGKQPDDIRQCYELGVQAFLMKPLNIFALKGQVQHAFNLVEYVAKFRSEITAKQVALEQLQVQHEFLRATYEGMAEGAITLDNSYRIRMISARACQILTISNEDAEGCSVAEILGSPFAGPKGELVKLLKANKKTSEIEANVLCPSGAMIPIHLSVVPLRRVQSNQGWLLLFRDIREEERMLREKGGSFSFGRMISCDPQMKIIFDLIETVAMSDATVFVKGESGTGKELVAREIHLRSYRAQGPFHAVNCAAISPNLLESEFFGHEQGAFTNAHQMKRGRFELAHEGTLFLDEITEIPLELQGKLLRALEEKQFERVGGTSSIKVDIRVVAATNRDVEEMIKRQAFREDLYYRLHVVPIDLPPLRERSGDITTLTHKFIVEFNKRDNRQVRGIVAEALQCLKSYAWPGNIRELYHAIEYAFVTSKGATIHKHHLPQTINNRPNPSDFSDVKNEKEMLLEALRKTNFHKGKAAALLGMAPSTLYRKRRKYGI